MNFEKYFWAYVFAALLGLPKVVGLESKDCAVFVRAVVIASPCPQITLSWAEDVSIPIGYEISRKLPEEKKWHLVAEISGAIGTYSDQEVVVGQTYEYQVKKIYPDRNGYGYLSTGIQIPPVESRGKILLLVEKTYANSLAIELQQLAQDFIGDGWIVIRHEILRTGTAAEAKELIRLECAKDPVALKSVFLFGRIPVPYAGRMAPDGHFPSHFGAWPADAYYGDMEESHWSDESVEVIGSNDPRHRNVVHDGRFDQSTLQSVELAVGRVDFSDMPSFELSEEELLRQYLVKDHAFRHKQLPVKRRGVILDLLPSPEAVAGNGWRNFVPLVGAENVITVGISELLPTLAKENYLFSYACGSGSYSSLAGFGESMGLANGAPQAVFTLLFGSYFGDWDSTDNVMRSTLASPSGGLTCVWAGRPSWFLHRMGMGETIGESALLTQNNDGLYWPPNFGAKGVHIALLGDPTLRLHPIAPPLKLKAKRERASVWLTWTPSLEDYLLGYHVYRGNSAEGPFTRLNTLPVTEASFRDQTAEEGCSYCFQVKTVKLETFNGTYTNLSQGAFATVSARNAEVVKQRTLKFPTPPSQGGDDNSTNKVVRSNR